MENLYNILKETFNISQTEAENIKDITEIKTWDSFSHMNLIIAIETTFNINLTADEIVQMKEISKIIEIIESKRG